MNCKGMNFVTWCRLDKEDKTKINYTLSGIWENEEHTEHFTSEDFISPIMMHRLRNSIIDKVILKNDEWYIKLFYIG